MIQQFYSWVYIQEDKNSNLKRYMYLSVHSSVIYNGQDTKATYLSINGYLKTLFGNQQFPFYLSQT